MIARFCPRASAMASRQLFFWAVVRSASWRDATLAWRASCVICSVNVMDGNLRLRTRFFQGNFQRPTWCDQNELLIAKRPLECESGFGEGVRDLQPGGPGRESQMLPRPARVTL